MNNKKNVTNITVVILLVALGAAGYFFFGKKAEQNTTSDDIALARQTLIEFFSFLNSGQYAAAERYYDDSDDGYAILRDWNPNVAPENHVELLKAGCENQLRCLKVLSVLSERQTAPTEFTFTVQFVENDGTLFARGPCCGASEEEMPTVTDFENIVRKKGNEFRVFGLPVYVP